MTTHDERYRLQHFVAGEKPPEGYLYSLLYFEYADPRQVLEKVVPVMDLVTRAASAGWPGDDEWRRTLPAWLMASFREHTPEELERIVRDRSLWANPSWSFGSWLDRMKDRCWEWWSSASDPEAHRLTVCVAVDGDPCSTAPLEHLVTAAGGRLVGVWPDC